MIKLLNAIGSANFAVIVVSASWLHQEVFPFWSKIWYGVNDAGRSSASFVDEAETLSSRIRSAPFGLQKDCVNNKKQIQGGKNLRILDATERILHVN